MQCVTNHRNIRLPTQSLMKDKFEHIYRNIKSDYLKNYKCTQLRKILRALHRVQ